LRWDIAAIPAGSAVQSAAIVINVTDATAGRYELYEARRAWVESQATWNQFAAGSAWQDVGAYGANDRGATLVGTLTAASTGAVTIALNSAGVALVQQWVDTPSTNRGLLVTNFDVSDRVDFRSREDATPSLRPRLDVTYASPGTGGDAG